MAIIILGISAFYHDSAAALLINGEIVAAAQEERFSRVKHDAGFPAQAIRYVLEAAGIGFEEVTAIAFYDKPLLKFERLLETYHAFVPRGWRSFLMAMPVWIKEKLFMRRMLRKLCKQLGASEKVPIYFPEHHLSHAASAFYPSPFEEAAVLTIDGVGEWATATICKGSGASLECLRELRFPHSVGLLYSAFTYFLGFKVNSGEYKLMGLAPYGDANAQETIAFKEKILATIVDIREDGSILLNMEYFDFATGLKMIPVKKWETLFEMPLRTPVDDILPSHMNLALAIQQVTEMIVIALAKTAQTLTGCKHLVMAGGVSLNCVANGKLAAAGIFENTWIQPAAGDAGGAIGAAYAAHHIVYAQPRAHKKEDAMQGALSGPAFSNTDVENMIRRYGATAQHIPDVAALTHAVSEKLAQGKVVGWFQGRMEFGPRALGNRSILGDPRDAGMQQRMNLAIKGREGFRPFAPAILEEDVAGYFEDAKPSSYMLFVTHLLPHLRYTVPTKSASWQDRLHHIRSPFPAITHVDYSARVQTVSKASNPVFHALLSAFKERTGCPMLINTSFNVRGEPIVCTPEDAYRAFIRTGMDVLVMGEFLFERATQQPVLEIRNMPFPED